MSYSIWDTIKGGDNGNDVGAGDFLNKKPIKKKTEKKREKKEKSNE